MKIENRDGFTLVEIMMSVALVAIVIGISTTSWLALARASSIAKQCSDMHADLRQAVDTMSKDIISASEVLDYHSGTISYIRVQAQRSGGPANVYYIASAGRLYQFEGAARIMAENITGMQITLYKEDGETVTTTPSEAFSVDISLSAQRRVNTETFDDTFQTRVMLRNKTDA